MNTLTNLYLERDALQEFENEIWAVIPEFENYEVSIYGRIFSHKSRKFLKPVETKESGYVVSLWSHGYGKTRYIHRLVAMMFKSNYTPRVQILHIDGDKANNHVDNLNLSGVEQFVRRKQLANAMRTARKVRVVEWDETYPSVKFLASHLDVNASNIYKCLNGDRKSHKGLSFEYVY